MRSIACSRTALAVLPVAAAIVAATPWSRRVEEREEPDDPDRGLLAGKSLVPKPRKQDRPKRSSECSSNSGPTLQPAVAESSRFSDAWLATEVIGELDVREPGGRE